MLIAFEKKERKALRLEEKENHSKVSETYSIEMRELGDRRAI